MTSDKTPDVWDVAVVGAGAAGLMAALVAARGGSRVLLLDSKEKIGAKILMSGGTRCNITNAAVTEKDFESDQKRTLAAVLKAFSPERALKFFKELGVEAVLEPGGKYFPSTHSGRTVLEALLRGTREAGVRLIPSRKVTRLIYEKEPVTVQTRHPEPACRTGRRSEGSQCEILQGFFRVEGDSFSYPAKKVILTTGGLSYPQTGSDGTGYSLAQSFGHSLVPVSPALTPLLTGDEDFKKLSGVSLPARLNLYFEGAKKSEQEGAFLFTHTGFSGPAALDISRHWVRLQGKGRAEIFANFLPAFQEEAFREKILTETREQPSRLIKTFLGDFLPRAFSEIFLKKMSIPESSVLNQWSRVAREKCVRNLFHYLLPVTGVTGYSKAEVTAGGVDLREIRKESMESRLQPGLFFAGEILDADGRIGGFNFQWAWASGFLAGYAACRQS